METIKNIASSLNIDEKTVAKIYLEWFRKWAFDNIERDKQRDIEKELVDLIYS